MSGSIGAKVLGPLSHGSLPLSSPADVRKFPKVRFNYFSYPRDLARCVGGLSKVGYLLKTKSLARFKFDKDLKRANGFKYSGPSLPMDYGSSNNSSLEGFCRRTTTTCWHYHGGCFVGKVVNGDFRVIGINRLRVVDASTFNIAPGAYPQATHMMLGL